MKRAFSDFSRRVVFVHSSDFGSWSTVDHHHGVMGHGRYQEDLGTRTPEIENFGPVSV